MSFALWSCVFGKVMCLPYSAVSHLWCVCVCMYSLFEARKLEQVAYWSSSQFWVLWQLVNDDLASHFCYEIHPRCILSKRYIRGGISKEANISSFWSLVDKKVKKKNDTKKNEGRNKVDKLTWGHKWIRQQHHHFV